VSIHSKNIIQHKQTIWKSRHVTTHNDLPAEWWESIRSFCPERKSISHIASCHDT
jgi:hypothetical protein